ncbi:MAG: MFS transporter, partial [Clostridia bacterium]|nr:MFS transporter [Clostridia bacterium]
GSLSISSAGLPKGGTALFALLALGGDLGAAAGPALVGGISHVMGENIRAGLLCGVCFPLLLAVSVLLLRTEKSGAAPTEQNR